MPPKSPKVPLDPEHVPHSSVEGLNHHLWWIFQRGSPNESSEKFDPTLPLKPERRRHKSDKRTHLSADIRKLQNEFRIAHLLIGIRG